LRPQEIQVGLLKRLRGTPIVRHDVEFGMVYSATAPYEILQTGVIDFATMQRLRRFSRYWDLIANSGNFRESAPIIWRDESPFENFLALSDWLYATGGQTHSLALQHLAELLFTFLTTEGKQSPEMIAKALWRDYTRAGRSDVPVFLREWVDEKPTRALSAKPQLARRQARHLA
jgi:hypothetical protein